MAVHFLQCRPDGGSYTACGIDLIVGSRDNGIAAMDQAGFLLSVTDARRDVTCANCHLKLAGLPQPDRVIEATMQAAREIAVVDRNRWKLVPIIPTNEMVTAMQDQLVRSSMPELAWMDGVAAAPSVGGKAFTEVSVSGEPARTWRCFHCDEVFTDQQAATDHFGTDLTEQAGCVQMLTEGQKAIVEDRREWRTRALKAEQENEQLGAQLSTFTFDLQMKFKGCKTLQDVAHLVDSLQGQVLANQEQADRYRWVREHEALITIREPHGKSDREIEESGDLLDAAIDREIANERGQG